MLDDLDLASLSNRSFKFLDFGAGTGCISASVLVRFPQSSGTLVDVNKRLDLNEHIQEAIKGRYNNISWDNVKSIPRHSFDLVISTDVLEHIPDWKSAFRSLVTYLAPGGYLYVQAPSRYPSPNWPYQGIVVNKLKGYFNLNDPGRHVRHGLSSKDLYDCAVGCDLLALLVSEDYVSHGQVFCDFKPRTHALFMKP